MTITFELTDTYGGDANYSWVQRGRIDLNENASELSIVKSAKAEAGLTNIRCRKENYGDTIALYPYGLCMVLFINFEY